MLIAEVNGERCKATKDAKGKCPLCGGEVIARCGEQKTPHWAHKSKKECDTWHENETEWHRMWKNYFPFEWQEIVKHDQQTGEDHRADVCTPQGFTLEFQHSHINPEERRSREAFYKNMNWVVDGTRLKNDYKRFEKGIKDTSIARFIAPIRFLDNGKQIGDIYEISFADELLPKNWLNSSVPVVFDFKGLNQIDNPSDLRLFTFCLFAISNSFRKYLAAIPTQIFIEFAKDGRWETFIKDTIPKLINFEKSKRIYPY